MPAVYHRLAWPCDAPVLQLCYLLSQALSEEQTDAYHRALSAAGEGNLRMGRSKDASEQFKKLMTLAPKGSPRSFEAKCGYAVRATLIVLVTR